MLSGFMFVTVILVMTFIGYYSGSSGNAPAASASTNQTATAPASAGTTATPAAAPSVSTNALATASAAPAPTNQVATPTASAATPATPPVSTNAPVPAATAPAPTNQVAATASSAASPAKPGTPPPVSTNAAAPAAAASATTNQVAAPATPAATPAATPSVSTTAPAAAAVAADADQPSRRIRHRHSSRAQAERRSIPNQCRRRQCFGINEPKSHLPSRCVANLRGQLRQMPQPADPDLQLARLQGRFADRWEIRRRVWDSWKGWYYKEAMPVPGSPESLAFTDAERLTIRNWVDSGADLGVAPAPAPAAPAPTNQVAGSAASIAGPAKPGSKQPSTTAPAGDVQAGRELFTSAGCVACHTIEGKGGKVGPDLSHEAKLGRSSQWLIAQITDPKKHNPATKMPPHPNLTPAQLKGLADYILNPAPGAAASGAPPLRPHRRWIPRMRRHLPQRFRLQQIQLLPPRRPIKLPPPPRPPPVRQHPAPARPIRPLPRATVRKARVFSFQRVVRPAT